MRTVGNTERKVGALNQGWQRWRAGYDYVAGIDADTVLAPIACLAVITAAQTLLMAVRILRPSRGLRP